MQLRFMGIFVIILLAYLAGHAFLFFSTIKFFNIISLRSRLIVALIFVFLAGIYFFASLVSHFGDNFLTRSFYDLSAFWLGFLINLIMAVALAWLLRIIFFAAGISFNAPVWSLGLSLAALFFSLYGVWNAFHPMIKNAEVEINGLPEYWKGKTIVQLSDVHLGHTLGSEFFKKIIQKVNDQKPDLVLITGDLFDGMDGNLANLVVPINELQPKDGIFFVTGNHETYVGLDEVFSALSKTKIVALRDEMRDLHGLQLVGLDYPARSFSRDVEQVLAGISGYKKEMPAVLMYHSPTELDAAEKAGIDLQLSGHTHKGQIFPFGFITKMVYGGYDYGFYKIGNLSLYVTNGAGFWGPPMRTGNTPEIPVIRLK